MEQSRHPHWQIPPGQPITFTITITPGFAPASLPPPPAPHPDNPEILRFPGVDQPVPEPPPVQPPVGESLTIRQVYQRWIEPEHTGDGSHGTLREDRTALDRWERVCVALGAGNPPVDRIDSELLTRVRNHLQAGRDGKLSPATVRKVFSVVRKTLRRADQEALIGRVPTIPRVLEPRRRPGVVTADELDLLYRHADAATWPRPRGLQVSRWGDLQPGDWWRCWLVLFATYGARTADVVSYKNGADGLLWSSIIDQPECPDPSIPGLSSQHGWLEYTPAKTKRTRGEPLLLPLSAAARWHIDRFRGLDAVRVFPNGRSKIPFAESFQAIRSAAGVSDDVTIADTGTRRGRKMRSIRKFCTNAWDSLREGLGGWVLGHSAQGTNAAHYRLALPQIVQLVEQFPLPESMQPVRTP